MAITSGDLNKLDTAMRQYFNAVYRASHAAYKDGFDLGARRAAVSDEVLQQLRDKVTAAADPINQTVFTFDIYAARQVEKLAREAATKDTRAGVDREVGLGKAAATFKSSGSLSIIAELDDSNIGGRGVPGQTSHAALIKEARGGNMLAQNYDAPGAKKATGSGIIPSAHAAEPAVKADHAKLALDYVLAGVKPPNEDYKEVRAAVVRIMGAAEGRTTPEKMAYLSAKFQALKSDPAVESDPKKLVEAVYTMRAIGALNLKNEMDLTGNTNWKNASTEAYFDKAVAKATALREKQENGHDISIKGAPKIEGASGERAPTYGYKGEQAPTETEIPVIAKNQVEALQKNLQAAGFDVGPTGADGKYGPNTHKALKAFAAKMTPPIEDLSSIDFTNPADPECARVMEALGFVQSAGEAKAAPAASKAGTTKPKAEAAPAQALKSQVAAAVAAVSSESNAAIDYRENPKAKLALAAEMITPQELPQKIKEGAIAELAKLKESGLSDQALNQISNSISVVDGKVYSPMLKAMEAAIGMKADGFMDARMETFLGEKGDEAAKKAVALAFNSGSITVSDASGVQMAASTPGQGSGKAREV